MVQVYLCFSHFLDDILESWHIRNGFLLSFMHFDFIKSLHHSLLNKILHLWLYSKRKIQIIIFTLADIIGEYTDLIHSDVCVQEMADHLNIVYLRPTMSRSLYKNRKLLKVSLLFLRWMFRCGNWKEVIFGRSLSGMHHTFFNITSS